MKSPMTMTVYVLLALGVVLGVGLLFTFERGPVEVVQTGYRGLAMEQVYNMRAVERQIPANQPPPVIPAVAPEGRRASEVYENVQVLGDLTEAEFINLMVAITAWVSPDEGSPNPENQPWGCAYCHAAGEPLSSDSLYTKVVSRRMIQMTRNINVNWEAHVGQTGVTCYTCHRGQPVPAEIWFVDPGRRPQNQGLAGNPAGQNIAGLEVGLTSLPTDPYTPFFVGTGDEPIRVIGNRALPHGNNSSIKQTEWTYGLMIHLSESLGVNCTFCHNSRSFSQWDQSPPQRVTAWHGIEMVRNLNADYLIPLQPVYPDTRLGPLNDAPKANCGTCHLGAYKPLYGANMLADHPQLDRLGPNDGPRRAAQAQQPAR